MQTRYTLDAENTVIATGGEWDAFARANDGAAAVSTAVIGQPVWGFIAGDDVASQFNALLFAARRGGAPVEMLYRCDAPWERRLMRMIVTPEDEGRVTLTHDLLSAERIAAPPIAYRHGHAERCALCGAVRSGDRWIDPFDAPTHVYGVGAHTVCPACHAATAKAIDAARAA
jgi:hypothetical protein